MFALAAVQGDPVCHGGGGMVAGPQGSSWSHHVGGEEAGVMSACAQLAFSSSFIQGPGPWDGTLYD